MRKQNDRVSVIPFRLLMPYNFLISAFRKQQTKSTSSSNRTATDQTAQEPRNPHPGTTPHPEPVIDSGMIEVALVIASVGFLLFQFGSELDLPEPLANLSNLTVKQIGKIIVFMGILAAFLLHSSFWEVWIGHQHRKTGRLNGEAITVLIAHAIITIVLFAGVFVSAYFAGGNWGLGFVVLISLLVILGTFRNR